VGSIIKAFVPESTPSMAGYYNQLLNMLGSAGINYCTELNNNDHITCSIHLIGNEYVVKDSDADRSVEEFWLDESIKLKESDSEFRIFIWHPYEDSNISLKQEEFINSFRNKIGRNMTFCKHEAPLLFVEDVRSIVYEEKQFNYDTKFSNVFFIYNEIDEIKANDIVELVCDILKVEKLNIASQSELNYFEFIEQQTQKSEITAIYYNHTASWALPFTQQIWKKIGGASSNKTILLIGDNENEQNEEINFDAPNIINLRSSTELIPLEIKILYDKLFSN
jgi:hypothetical protein